MGVSRNRKRLDNIIRFMKQHNLDGFDCDWEPSWIDDKDQMEEINNAITFHYIKFIKEFRNLWMLNLAKEKKIIFGSNFKFESYMVFIKINKSLIFKKWLVALFRLIALMNYDNDLGSQTLHF